MKSTGEVMGVDRDHPAALAKALMAAGMLPPADGSVLLSIADRDKPAAAPLVRALTRLGLPLYATEGTARYVRSLGAKDVTVTHRIGHGSPDVVELVRQGAVDAVVNTISGGGLGTIRDGFQIRRAAVERRIPCFTSLDTARAALELLVDSGGNYDVRPREEYLRLST
jgi:carbamoyl-phosphate synthase large subunit